MRNKKFNYSPTDGSCGIYSVCYGDHIEELNKFFNTTKKGYKSPIYIVDKNLSRNYINIVESITGYKAENIILVDPSKKTIDRIIKIWEKMVHTVPDIGFVIGGGTVCDLAGLACATYQRGIPRILFPTTVFSMVDASIGGKSGIDFADVKNSIGAINYPLSTINYLPFLKSLNKREYVSGFAEIIKAAVLYDKKFFENVYIYSKLPNKFKSGETLNIFYKSSYIKAKVCEEENRKKVSLLYGHAVGHAIERYETTHLRHGDCVAIGMTIEGAIACLIGIWKKEEWLEQQEVIKNIGLPSELPKYIQLDDLTKKMSLYKKLVDKENYLFSLPKEIGCINNSEKNYLTNIKKDKMISVLKKTLIWIDENSIK